MNRADRPLDLLALGDPCVDLVYLAPRLPGWDDKARGTLLGLFGGGTEANAACNAARLGWRCALFGHTGDDLHADFIHRDLAQHGMQLQHLVRQARGSSAVALVGVSPQGERSVMWLPPGIDEDAPPPDRGAERRDALARSRWAYTMPYRAGALATLARETETAGTRLAIDVEREGARAVAGGLAPLLQQADLVFLNQGGFEAATGLAPDGQTLQALCRGGRARTIVVTLGAEGALAADRDEGAAQAAACPAEVVDTTGAGDTFNATFLVARDRGAPLAAALRQACRAAARTVAVFGARGALATFSAADAGPPPSGVSAC
jgi:sugar/nucleoside kinase (ribokinase family)